jgi:hypothetical protein
MRASDYDNEVLRNFLLRGGGPLPEKPGVGALTRAARREAQKLLAERAGQQQAIRARSWDADHPFAAMHEAADSDTESQTANEECLYEERARQLECDIVQLYADPQNKRCPKAELVLMEQLQGVRPTAWASLGELQHELPAVTLVLLSLLMATLTASRGLNSMESVVPCTAEAARHCARAGALQDKVP